MTVLVAVLVAACVVPFAIPRQHPKEGPPERGMPPEGSAPPERTSFVLPEGCSQEQIAICGMLLCELDEVQQRFWNLPNGVIVTQVEENSTAADAGVLPGDVIIRIGDTAADSVEACLTLFGAYSDGESVRIELFRCGEEIEIALPAATADGK